MKILLGNFRELFGISSGYLAPCLREYDDQDTDLTTYLGPTAKCNNRSSSSTVWHCDYLFFSFNILMLLTIK